MELSSSGTAFAYAPYSAIAAPNWRSCKIKHLRSFALTLDWLHTTRTADFSAKGQEARDITMGAGMIASMLNTIATKVIKGRASLRDMATKAIGNPNNPAAPRKTTSQAIGNSSLGCSVISKQPSATPMGGNAIAISFHRGFRIIAATAHPL
jgi:hypothetical protein